ncbi:MAG: hypothetical protein BGO78_10025 [Chloroflexi bacterium 44-23]|nr:MAG: hypothetical protein BGO78_10025 [Chloroflexi bacterium 44-23]
MNNQILLFLLWYLLLTIFGILAAPWVMTVFKHVPDRGYSITKMVGLLVAAFLHWFLTSLGLLQNSSAGILSAILIAGLFAVWFAGKEGRQQSLKWIKENQRTVLFIEVLFLFSFALMAFVRSFSPDIWGTEKPMELMFINSILRSPTFPPQDAWLSGFAISYYYFGYVMVAMLAAITGTSGGVAFNLGIALVFALASTAAFGVVLNLITLRTGRELRAHNLEEGSPKKSLERAVFPALLAPLLLLLVGNFYGVLDVLHQHNWMGNLEVPALVFDASRIDPALGAVQLQPAPIQARTMNFWEWMDLKQLGKVNGVPQPIENIQQPNWFFASRAIQDRNLGGQSQELIDEFPAFSFLLADLHPHVLALPYVIVCLLLALEWFLSDRLAMFSKEWWQRTTLSALILGSLIFLNTWDFPIYAFIFLIVIFLRNYPLELGADWKQAAAGLLREAGPVLGLAVLLYLPFMISLQTQAGGILPNLVFPSRFRQELVMFGVLLIPISVFVLAYVRRHKAKFDFAFAWKFGLGLLGVLLLIVVLLVVIILARPEGGIAALGTVYPFSWRDGLRLILQRRLVESTTLIYALLLVSASAGFLWGWRHKNRNSSLFVFVMIFTGALLLLGPELLYLRDQFGNRMNTVFKFYFQVWVLWSLACAYIIWFITVKTQRFARVLWVVLVSVLVAMGLVYTIGTAKMITNNFSNQPTLDGMAYFYRNYPQDGAVVAWLKENVAANSVVLEGTKGAYWMEGRSSRFAMATGIPTVMGWVNHESQWRGKQFSNVATREEDIRTIYTSRDWGTIQALLDVYHVNYIIISPEETQWYGAVYLPVFEQNMQLVFSAGDTMVFGR